ncbi:MAG: M23 family metallopeptidase [Desulfovibrio sp.]|jgi:murein DD-endopeptidase MepM/ murein hydrolase activator NlpD|nr:M23 family metallopeptidase [Desulfovibrio sp.]
MTKRLQVSGFTAAVSILLLTCSTYAVLRDSDAPVLIFTPDTGRASPSLVMTLTVADATSPIQRILIQARLGSHLIPLLDKTYRDGEKSRRETFSLRNSGLKDGPIELEVSATDASLGNFGRGNTSLRKIPLVIDSVPPRILVKTSPPNVRRGGSGCVLYSLSKEIVQTGVLVGDIFFPAFRQANGYYLCFFAFPYNLDRREFAPRLTAVDPAGNSRTEPLPVVRLPRDFKLDTISLSPNFLEKKDAEFSALVPGGMSALDRFLQVNGRIRRENTRDLLEIGRNTAPDILWSSPFLRLPKSASKAGFADFRTYLWNGEKVDEQVHLGLDLASVAQAPVPAANAGRVVFAGYLGIYGNMVILDHGLGLQSLYSHLSSYSVGVGQAVGKGEIIGATGATGMAGGDHLHFGILLSGLEVSPLEWLDAHWIRDNIADRVKAAGGSLSAGVLPESGAGGSR